MFYIGLSYSYQVKQDGSNPNPKIDSADNSWAEQQDIVTMHGIKVSDCEVWYCYVNPIS